MPDDELLGRKPRARAVLRLRPERRPRTPRVLVDMLLLGGLVLVFTLARRQRGALELRALQAADSGPGVVLNQREGGRLATIAIEAGQSDLCALHPLHRRVVHCQHAAFVGRVALFH